MRRRECRPDSPPQPIQGTRRIRNLFGTRWTNQKGRARYHGKLVEVQGFAIDTCQTTIQPRQFREEAAVQQERTDLNASGILADVFREVYLGGSSVGRGLKKADRYYLEDRLAGAPKPAHLFLPGAADLNPDVDQMPLVEEAFYVIDLGIVVSQVYQCKNQT
jgi:hypothetical protein